MGAAAGEAQTRAHAPVVTWIPETPVRGSFARVVLRPEAGSVLLQATLAGEPLHFESAGDSILHAVAVIPASVGGEALVLVFESAERVADSISIPLPGAPRSYTREKLRTDPRFTRSPDSALAARIAIEREEVLAVWRAAHAAPRLWDEPFARPRPGRITSTFGTEREFNGEVQSRHWGTDFDGAMGSPVRATNRGVVAAVVDHFYSGRAVYVHHGAGVVTGYMHLSKVEVLVGDTVARGQVIGRVGASGRVTGPHLHWLAHYGMLAVDPLSLVTLEPPPPVTVTGTPSDSTRR